MEAETPATEARVRRSPTLRCDCINDSKHVQTHPNERERGNTGIARSVANKVLWHVCFDRELWSEQAEAKPLRTRDLLVDQHTQLIAGQGGVGQHAKHRQLQHPIVGPPA